MNEGIVIVNVAPEEAQALSAFAAPVVKEHYDPIIGPAQNDYMIARFQSAAGLREQMERGVRYCRALVDGETAGFCAFYPEDGKMFLSKLYVRGEARKKGVGRAMFEHVARETRKQGLSAVFLHVNRGNHLALAVYERLGFKRTGEKKTDIGQGYVMDDYVLEFQLAAGR